MSVVTSVSGSPVDPGSLSGEGDATWLAAFAQQSPDETCRVIVDQLSRLLGRAPVAAFQVDPTGKQLLVSAMVEMPEWFSDLVLPTAPTSSPIADVVAQACPWQPEDSPQPVQLPGLEIPLGAIAPIALPGSSRSHGALIVLGADGIDISQVRASAHLMALSLESDYDRRHGVPLTFDPEAGVPDLTQLLAHLDRVSSDGLREGPVALYRVAVECGPLRAARDAYLERDDLARVGAILQQVVRPTDLVAHLGHADYAVVATELASENEANALGIRIVEAISGTASDCDHPIGVYEASVGAVLIDGPCNPQTLLEAAASARSDGTDGFGLVHSSALVRGPSEQAPITGAQLAAAITDGRIQPWYQPLFDLDSMRTVAVEALARWVEPNGDLISPGNFIPGIQDHGLMGALTESMLDQVARDVSQWHRDGHVDEDFKASVNVSMSDVTDGKLPALVSATLAKHDLAASMLCLELTETEAMADVEHSLTMLHQLKALGISLSIDDFGTGYSSLSYLSQLPVDIVKIDMAFVQGLLTRRGDEAIIGAVVDVAEAVDLVVLAEGIETEEELVRLRHLGVQMGQGFLVSPAIRPEALIEHLAHQDSPAI